MSDSQDFSRRRFLKQVASVGVLGAATAIGGLSLGTQFPIAQALPNGSVPTIHPVGYIIFIDSNGYFNAIDGNTGAVTYNSQDAASTIAYAISQLTDGGLIVLRQRANYTNWNISTSINVPNNIYITGEGPSRPILQTPAGGNFPIFSVTGQEVGFFNFSLNGSLGGSTTSQHGFLIQPTGSFEGYRFENLGIGNFNNHGIRFLAQGQGNINDVNIDHCHLYGCNNDGIKLETVAAFNLVNSRIERCLGCGIEVANCGEGYIANNNVSYLNGHGINLYNANTLSIQGNEISTNTNDGILVNQGTWGINILGNICCNNSYNNAGQGWSGIQVSNGSNALTILGNSCRNVGSNTSQYDGIVVGDTCDYVTIVGNDLRSNRDSGLKWSSSGTHWNSIGNFT